MSQATLLGICSDNVITILQPSSTIECLDGSDQVVNTLTIEGLATFNGGLISTEGPFQFDASGNVEIDGVLVVNGGLSSTTNVEIDGSLILNGGAVIAEGTGIEFIDASGTHLLESIDGNLYFDNELLARANDIQDVGDWALYPALANVDMNGKDLTNAADIFSNGGTLVPPAGSMMMYAGSAAPAGWLMCDGTSYPTASYTRLQGVIGYTFGGAGPTFNVPDMRSRIPTGAGQGPSLSNYPLGSGGGVETVTLDTTQIPSHTHGVSGNTGSSATGISAPLPNHTHNYDRANGNNLGGTPIGVPSYAGNSAVATTGVNAGPIAISFTDPTHSHSINLTSDATGGGLAHTNIQPYLALNYIIKW